MVKLSSVFEKENSRRTTGEVSTSNSTPQKKGDAPLAYEIDQNYIDTIRKKQVLNSSSNVSPITQPKDTSLPKNELITNKPTPSIHKKETTAPSKKVTNEQRELILKDFLTNELGEKADDEFQKIIKWAENDHVGEARITGVKLRLLHALVDNIDKTSNINTVIIQSNKIAEDIGASKFFVLQCLNTLEKTNFIKKIKSETGRYGGSWYFISPKTIEFCKKNPAARRRQKIGEGEKNSNAKLDMNSLLEFGFSRTHKGLIEKLIADEIITLEQAQDSIHAFSYDMASGMSATIKSPPSYLMSLLKKGTPYASQKGWISEEDQIVLNNKSRLEAQKKEREQALKEMEKLNAELSDKKITEWIESVGKDKALELVPSWSEPFDLFHKEQIKQFLQKSNLQTQ